MIDIEAVNARHDRAVEAGRSLNHMSMRGGADPQELGALLRSCSDIPELLDHIREVERKGIFPSGGQASFEYAVRLSDGLAHRMHPVGADEWAERHSTHQRAVVVWPEENVPPVEWARYVGRWVEK